MTEYSVEGKSREKLRMLAEELRDVLGIKNKIYVPIVEFLDALGVVFDDFSYEIVEDDYFPNNIHAETDIRTGHIRIKQCVYDNACAGAGRDRMTIAHEIAHYFLLCICEFKLERNFENREVPAFEDPEWQAKCFAGEFMVSKELTRGMNPIEIAEKCGVSLDAALIQYNKNNF